MEKQLTCIICPRGCTVNVKYENETYTAFGNACPKGEKYAINECTNPLRTVTSIIRVSNREDTMVSVKTENPIPKEKIFEVMKIIRSNEICAPIKIGDVIIENCFGTRIIATKTID